MSWRSDDEIMLLILDAWTGCCGRETYPSTAILRRATRAGTDRVVRLRDRMLRSGLIVLPRSVAEARRHGQLPSAIECGAVAMTGV